MDKLKAQYYDKLMELINKSKDIERLKEELEELEKQINENV